MGRDEAMSGRVAIGVGCRKGCSVDAVEGLIYRALALIDDTFEIAGLFTLLDKRDEPGLADAATHLNLTLHFLTRDTLRSEAARVQTAAPHAQAEFGVPSVAEAAALAGAGPDAVLIVSRIAANGATCAIARAP